MARIFGGVEGIKKPSFVSDFNKYEREEEKYISQIKKYASVHGQAPEAGEEIAFGVADGSARYVIFRLRPPELIHLDVCDGYQFPYAKRLTAKDIRAELKMAKGLAELFSRKTE